MKKLIAILISMTLLCVSLIAFPQNAYNIKAVALSGADINGKLDSLMSSSTYKPGNSNPQKNCWYFINAVCNQIFGHSLAPQADNEYELKNYSANFTKIGNTLTISSGNLTEQSLKSLISSAMPGDIVQMNYTTWKNADSLHVMMVYSVSDTGIVFYHAGSTIYFGAGSGSDKLNLGKTGATLTWTQFKNYLKNSGDGISMYRSKKASYSGSSSSGINHANMPTRTLQYTSPTMKGNDVIWVQLVLNDICGSGLDTDGSYGQNTVAAVKKFQSEYGLSSNGICDSNTVQKMRMVYTQKHCSHTYSTSYDSAHPHKIYKECSQCSYKYYTGNTQNVSSCTTCNPSYSVHVHYGQISGYELAHPHVAYGYCADSSCGKKFTRASETTKMEGCSICYPHTHSYGTYYDSVHPHKEYKKCSCGDTYYTGNDKKVTSCDECYHVHSGVLEGYETVHPHKAYSYCKKSSCGQKFYLDGMTAKLQGCDICYPHSHNYIIYYELEHPHKEYKKCVCGDVKYTGKLQEIKTCADCFVQSHTHFGNEKKYEEQHPHYEYRICLECGEKYYNFEKTTEVEDCLICKPHEHDYKTHYAEEHPHFEYKECELCGDNYQTGVIKKESDCDECKQVYETSNGTAEESAEAHMINTKMLITVAIAILALLMVVLVVTMVLLKKKKA